MSCTYHLKAGNSKPQPSAPYKSSTLAILRGVVVCISFILLARNCGEFNIPSVFHHLAWLWQITKYQREEFSFDSGRLQGTLFRRHLYNGNEPEISLKKTLRKAFLIATHSLQLASPLTFKSRNKSGTQGKPKKTAVLRQPEFQVQDSSVIALAFSLPPHPR